MTNHNRTSSAVSIESKPATIAKSSHPLPLAKMLDIFDPGTSPFGSAHLLPIRSDVVTQPGNSPFGAQVKPHESGVISGPGTSPFGNAHDMIDALNAINAKAAQLGWAGAPLESDVQPEGGGFVRHFENADIYFSKATGAYEVNGAIRDKYNILGASEGLLGLPLTDESATPDGIGRFNHFQGGSIYWTPALGAVMIRGAIRNRWAAQGWETGPLGYPVQDEHRYATIDPAGDPNTAWSLFENGAVVTSGGNTDVARTVEVSPDTLRCLVRQEFDRVMHESPDNVGLHAPSETIAVSPSYPRAVTFGIHGFRDDGLAPDTDFDITVAFRFGLTWEAEGFTEPETKNLAVSLVSASITAHGVAADAVASGVRDGIQNAFAGPRTVGSPLAAGGNITPRTPDLIDVLVTAEGGLRVLLNPLPDFATGGIRAFGAQKAIEALGCQQ
jgi:LGFP repeat